MEQGIPDIGFNQKNQLDFEVFTFKRLYEILKKIEDHDPFSIHRIKFYLILIVIKRSYTHFIDFKNYTIEDGSALFIAKNQTHQFSKDLDQSEGYAIIFNSFFTEKYYFLNTNFKFNRLFNYHIESPLIHPEEFQNDSFVDIAKNLHVEYQTSSEYLKSQLLGSLLNVLLLKAERVKELGSNSRLNSHALSLFNNFRDYLEVEYTIQRSSRYYASKMGISYKYLNEVVKKITGNTVKSFIDQFVLIEIKRQLATTSLSIKEISYKTGFDEPSNMVKFFKKHTQTTPLKFRNA